MPLSFPDVQEQVSMQGFRYHNEDPETTRQ